MLAAGGTGGHIFPAQAVATEILTHLPESEILFAGSGLKTNRYFDGERFPFRQIASTTIFQSNIFNLIKAPFKCLKGIWEAVALMRSFKPDLVVGFGSFHSAPVLCAALLYKVPIVLFEANAVPGRVNKLFSPFAKWCATYFPDAGNHLKAKSYLTQMPFWHGRIQKSSGVTKAESRAYLGLHPEKTTLLIFGGSQGAASINRMVTQALFELDIDKSDLQIIHITGSNEAAHEVHEIYSRMGITHKSKGFESHMHLVWPGVDLAISRAGAGSIAEQIKYEVPSILIPYPYATKDHQNCNGRYMAETVKGAAIISDSDVQVQKLTEILGQMLDSESNKLHQMRASIGTYKQVTRRHSLTHLILEELA